MMIVSKRTALPVFLLLFFLSGLLTAQQESETYRFSPAYEQGAKWHVDYQSQFSCRFRVVAQGEVVSKRNINIVENRSYVKKFLKLVDGHPQKLKHFYISANRKRRHGNNNPRSKQLEEQGIKVRFEWSPETESYRITSSSNELTQVTKDRLRGRELFEYFLPDHPVNPGSDPWTPDVDQPVSMMFGNSQSSSDLQIVPEFERFVCELSEVREENDQTLAVISILMDTGDQVSVEDGEVFARLEGELLYNLTAQKPVKFTISSRPAGISFRRDVEDTTVHVENMGLFITTRYSTATKTPDLNKKNNRPNDTAPAESASDQNKNSNRNTTTDAPRSRSDE